MKKFKYKVTADDSLDNIGRAVATEARSMLASEFSEIIENTPKITEVDYRNNPTTVNLDAKKTTPYGYDPMETYSHINAQGNISAARTGPKQEEIVREIYKDGSHTDLSRKDFEKKVKNQSVNAEDIDSLGKIVRSSSKDAQAYENWDDRTAVAYEIFDRDKYLIEETAGRIGVPASLLSSVYFSKIAESGNDNSGMSTKYARYAYKRVYGTQLTWDDDTLKEYLQTPQGLLDFAALALRGEAEYLDLNIADLNSWELGDILRTFGEWDDASPSFVASVIAYNPIFEDIYSKLPGKGYEITIE